MPGRRPVSWSRVRPAFPLLLIPVLVPAACSDGDAPRPAPAAAWAGSSERLELIAISKRPQDEPRVVRRLFPPPAIEPWRAEAERVLHSDVRAGPGEAEVPGYRANDGSPTVPALVVGGPKGVARRVVVPLDVAARTYDQVFLRVTSPEREDAGVALLRAGRELLRAGPIAFHGSKTPRVVAFDLPGARALAEEPDQLAIELAGRAEGALVVEVALGWRSPSGFLPAPGAPELVALRADALDLRRGVGLSSRAPLAADFDVPAGAELAFSTGAPAALRLSGDAPVLVVALASADGGDGLERVERVPLSGAPTWRAAAIDLAPFAGRRARATFALESGLEEAGGSAAECEALCVVAEPRLRAAAPNAPSVLLVTSDTHRADHLGRAPAPRAEVRTPALDALAARGVLFADAFAATNTTNPSHVAIMTSLPVRDTRVTDNLSPLADGATTLAERFGARGWRTFAAVSARHLVHAESGLGQGFERMSAPADSERRAAGTVDELLAWLEEPGISGEPLFCWLHVFDAHSPYEPPPPYDRRYYPPPRDPYDRARTLQYPGRFLPLYLRGVTDVEFPRAQYRAEIDYLDEQVGRVLARERFRAGVTAFTADHGESFGRHGVWWDHAELYPDSVRVPLILAWPGAPAGARCDAAVSQTDLGRTLLNLAGLVALDFGGRDLRAFVEGSAAPAPRFALSGYGYSAMVEDGGWYLILHLADHHQTSLVEPRVKHQVEIYHLAVDRDCERDLIALEPERAAALRRELIEWLRAASPAGLALDVSASAAQRERLAAIGYTEAAPTDAGRPWFDGACACEWCGRFR